MKAFPSPLLMYSFLSVWPYSLVLFYCIVCNPLLLLLILMLENVLDLATRRSCELLTCPHPLSTSFLAQYV